mmetsp:Transcript_148322/g.413159  ORF Transcript_148322/g.413159 Transcript_148322/m.413159 type:complete len:415 (+) Transcript_148322:119-1363(+)
MTRQVKKDVHSSNKGAKKEARSLKSAQKETGLASGMLLGARATLLVVVLVIGYAVSSSGVFNSSAEKKMHILPRFLFFMVAQAVATEFFVVLLLQVGRWLCGEGAAESWEPTREEMIVHDPKIPWPPIQLLSSELKSFVSRPGQPFFLNHVTGRQRCKDACMRIGMNLASFTVVWCTCRWMDKRTLASIGLTLNWDSVVDVVCGFSVGVMIVFFIFVVELLAGWVQFLQAFEVFDPSESFGTCILWDVVFHLNVALNEELPLRGWMLHNLADAFVDHFHVSRVLAFAIAVLTESAFFVAMHLRSPGGSRLQSMLNIFVGGISAGLNVMFTGGRLGFALGWHFGWNISMGNVFGLSTSGIPISATFVSVVPHPDKQAVHGGEFGPEGGLAAPVAYALGVALLSVIYGLPRGAGSI